jgi:hypothetical protein
MGRRDNGRVVQLLRGGSWNNNPRNCPSAYRNHNQPDNANNPDNATNHVGFRVVCLPSTLPGQTRWKGSSGYTRSVTDPRVPDPRVQIHYRDQGLQTLIRTGPGGCPAGAGCPRARRRRNRAPLFCAAS